MNKLIATLALVAAASAGPAVAGNVGISIRIGEPNFYGELHVESGYRPRVIYSQPVVVERRYRNAPVVYLRVPADHSRNWRRYCGRYDACGRQVYFVRDEWYRDVYAPRYRARHWHDDRRDHRHDRGHDRRDDRRDARRDDRRDDRHDRRDDRRDHDRDDRGRDDRGRDSRRS